MLPFELNSVLNLSSWRRDTTHDVITDHVNMTLSRHVWHSPLGRAHRKKIKSKETQEGRPSTTRAWIKPPSSDICLLLAHWLDTLNRLEVVRNVDVWMLLGTDYYYPIQQYLRHSTVLTALNQANCFKKKASGVDPRESTTLFSVEASCLNQTLR